MGQSIHVVPLLLVHVRLMLALAQRTLEASRTALQLRRLMGVLCADDVMLNYQSTSYHDAAGVRQVLGLRPAPEFLAWLEERGVFRDGRLTHGEEAGRRRLLAGIEKLRS